MGKKSFIAFLIYRIPRGLSRETGWLILLNSLMFICWGLDIVLRLPILQWGSFVFAIFAVGYIYIFLDKKRI